MTYTSKFFFNFVIINDQFIQYRHSGIDSHCALRSYELRQAIPPVSLLDTLRVKANLLQTDLCHNPDPMDGFKIAIHGIGYPLPGGYN